LVTPKTLSLEIAKDGINVNTICPGYIDTTRLVEVFTAGTESPRKQSRNKLIEEIPMGRIGTTDDIANLVALLGSPAGSYITGCSIPVDGGLLRGVR
jgi:3-oxoacyl-[acyl-carrier protein] reductase